MLVLHIGPPKTATSSLQKALQTLPPPNIRYLGITQPRVPFDIVSSCESQYLAESLYLRCAYPAIDISCSAALESIAAAAVSGCSIILSEEMFLVDNSPGLPWQEKLAWLYKLLSSFEPVPLVVIRHPLDATESLCRELYISLPWLFRLLPSLFPLSNTARVYDYPCLLNTLLQAGYEDVILVDFHALCTGLISSEQLLGRPPGGSSLQLPHENRSVKPAMESRRSFRLLNPLFRFLLQGRVASYHAISALLRSSHAGKYQISKILAIV